MRQIYRCLKNGTGFGRGDRITYEYTAGHESDLSVFQGCICSGKRRGRKAVYGFILSVIGINGVPEAIVAGVLTALIGKTLMKKNMKERLGFTHGFSD